MTSEPPEEPKPPKKPGTFAGKDDPRRHKLPNMLTPEERAAREAADVPVVVEGEGVLGAMRHVLLNGAKHDKTPLQKLYRDMRKGSAVKFGELYQRLEREAVAGGGSSAPVGNSGVTSPATAPPPADLGTAKLIELAREKLRRLAGGV